MRLSGRTRVVGVWGCPVSHSRSPAMQNAALEAMGLDWVYVPFEVVPEALPVAVASIRALGLVGVNLTVPHKEAVLPLLDVVDEDARRIGSVNTVHNRDGILHGYSTDGPGFLHALAGEGEATEGRQALILGAGGSARAVAFALAGHGGRVQIANRTRERAEALAAQVNQFYPGAASVVGWGADADAFDLLVNTTSLGMDPHPEMLPLLPRNVLRPSVFVCDLVYAPIETRLLAQARAAGCRVINGLPMLVAQGALSLALWTGLAPASIPVEVMHRAALPESA
jgi:shikimate dehydrogenase